MELDFGQSIFDKMDVSYEELRKETQPITKIKDYYRSKLRDGEELWWIDQQTNEENVVSPIIRSYGTLENEEKERFLAESMILFPEIFSNSQTKFEKVAAYLITSYNAVSSSLRDKFTAGGQKEIVLSANTSITVPRIYSHLFENAQLINKVISLIEEEKLSYHWNISKVPSDRLTHWKILLEKNTDPGILAGHSATEIFETGLNYEKNSQE
ncbi:MAG: hypothetical protein PHT88_03560 [Candidatus Moranbacteria bacterium]|nr:hypothetical protein [Candidatus Moranbacteria bacterium]